MHFPSMFTTETFYCADPGSLEPARTVPGASMSPPGRPTVTARKIILSTRIPLFSFLKTLNAKNGTSTEQALIPSAIMMVIISLQDKSAKKYEAPMQRPEKVQEQLTQLIFRHWESWVDQKLRALGP
jgi:hypothetical protein